MVSLARKLSQAGVVAVLLMAAVPDVSVAQKFAQSDDGFPFGTEMQLEVGRQPGSKRIPNIEIGDAGEVVLELWCKGGKGQFSVAGNTVIFVAGAMENRNCAPDRAQADDELVAALTDAATWKRQGDVISFVGTKTLRFRINTN
jgi:heat shock protein HslJ